MKTHSIRKQGRAVAALLILLKHLTAHARWLFAALLLFYAVSGIRTIGSNEQALLLRFGKIQPKVHGPGLLIGMPDPFDRLIRFETGREFSIPLNGWATGGVKIGDPDKAVELTDQELTLAIQESRNGGAAQAEFEKPAGSTLDPVTGLRINQQIGAQAAQGAELALAFSPARDWRLEGNVAWTWQTEFKDFNENLGAGIVSRSGNTPPNVPDLVAGAYVAKTFGTRWRLGGGPRYVAPRTANNANYITTPGYTTLEASVSYNAGRWSATLRGRNLLDREYEEWATAGGLMRRLADPRNAELSLRTSF